MSIAKKFADKIDEVTTLKTEDGAVSAFAKGALSAVPDVLLGYGVLMAGLVTIALIKNKQITLIDRE